MNDNDKKLKAMWNKAENFMEGSGYESETIERFMSKRSNSIADKIRKTLQIDIALKFLFAVIFTLDTALYFKIQPKVAWICITAIIIVIPLIMFEFRVISRFNRISDYGMNTKEKLSKMLAFLKNDFLTAVLSITTTYLFLYISGLLLYFFVTYGQLRRLGNMDIFVFSTLALIGIFISFTSNYAQVRYQIKHIETCLSDLNDNLLEIVTSNIEIQRKHDKTTKMLFGLVLIFGFIVLIVILKKLGF
ncbi:hypothetical protein OU798_24530 [Prolixibacteraceae bacterium Z1-6]|uniref:Uncharacterized protein n=1 Tax=Draconibacterium aestuarii TaxID=2998507 RepID=A0A9X3J9F8_9BACT|nr:hypothetical protein [Prolixibacteraceae bacterium Z1-6]